MSSIFDKSITPNCEYCCNSKQFSQDDELLCSKQGVVRVGFSCRHFKYDPLKRIPKKATLSGSFSKEDFSL